MLVWYGIRYFWLRMRVFVNMMLMMILIWCIMICGLVCLICIFWVVWMCFWRDVVRVLRVLVVFVLLCLVVIIIVVMIWLVLVLLRLLVRFCKVVWVFYCEFRWVIIWVSGFIRSLGVWWWVVWMVLMMDLFVDVDLLIRCIYCFRVCMMLRLWCGGLVNKVGMMIVKIGMMISIIVYFVII